MVGAEEANIATECFNGVRASCGRRHRPRDAHRAGDRFRGPPPWRFPARMATRASRRRRPTCRVRWRNCSTRSSLRCAWTSHASAASRSSAVLPRLAVSARQASAPARRRPHRGARPLHPDRLHSEEIDGEQALSMRPMNSRQVIPRRVPAGPRPAARSHVRVGGIQLIVLGSMARATVRARTVF